MTQLAVAYGGVPVGDYFGQGARHLVNPDAQLTQSGFEEPTPELDPKHCSEIKDNKQCRAYKVKGEEYCVGHLRTHEREE